MVIKVLIGFAFMTFGAAAMLAIGATCPIAAGGERELRTLASVTIVEN
jgi:hypothetical protein